MLTTCPKCRQSYVGLSCPRCDRRAPGGRQHGSWENPLAPGHWSQNAWVRCSVGVAVSQALFLGMRRWSEAAVGFFGPEDTFLQWGSHAGFGLWSALQCLCILFGSTLVGSGQREWLFYGLAVGFVNTILDLAIAGPRFEFIEPYFIVLLLGASFGSGVAGSFLGSAIWKPLEQKKATLEIAGGAKSGGIAVKDLFAGLNFITFRVNWLRVAIGVAVGVLGPPFAEKLYYKSTAALGISGWLADNPNVQTRIFILTIGVLSVLLGGFIAGTNSAKGPASGFWCGLLCVLGMVGVRYLQDMEPPLFGLPSKPFVMPDVMARGALYWGLCIVGAMFGARLLPPVINTGKRKLTKVAEI